MRISLDELKDKYVFKDLTVGFSQGQRRNIRYASESMYAWYTRVNLDGLQPYEYLNYAKNDISLGSVQGAINGISNAKKAIHQTIDALFHVWGLETAFKRANFPVKLKIMQTLDAFPVRMLDSLNQKRNMVEHEYKKIDVNEAADFVDVAEMFLMLAHPYLKHTVIGAFVGLEKNDRCLEWQIDFQNSQVLISEIAECPFFDSAIGRVYYDFPYEDKDKKFVQTVKIEKSNQDNWLIYLDLFVYLTKRNASYLQESDDKDSGLYTNRMSGEFAAGYFNDLDE